MSPRFRWRGRSLSVLPDAWWAALPSASAVVALFDLAAASETGVLEFTGDPGGAVYLVEGAVSQVVSPEVPGVADRVVRRLNPVESLDARGRAEHAVREGLLPPVDLRALLTDAAADAAVALVAGRSGTRFSTNQRHWAPLERPLSVDELLDEIFRRRRVLVALSLQAQPDAAVTRAVQLPVARVRLTPRQWDLVRLADGHRSPRAMARELGAGVFATTVEVASLVQAGVLAPVASGDAVAMPFLYAVSGS